MKKEQKAKRAKAQRPVQREPKQVLAELLEKLGGKLELKATSASQREAGGRGELSPNLDRLTVGVDLGDQWSPYCILGLQGETLSEGQLQTREAEVGELSVRASTELTDESFRALPLLKLIGPSGRSEGCQAMQAHLLSRGEPTTDSLALRFSVVDRFRSLTGWLPPSNLLPGSQCGASSSGPMRLGASNSRSSYYSVLILGTRGNALVSASFL